ncbi:MAG: GNAT family N-acetyltransferase [Gemmatimonadetes bacterium]|jgi:ribosomal protein S18 acetylase RimI-like enzyme|nr:GNAT family N-acetyltransferase [Gemmatimonadota bacterium]MBT7859428.1 GNAT family N-acetyltransferase [Gemmatimonadota bacterium]
MTPDQLVLKDARDFLDSEELRQVVLALDYPPEIRQSKADEIIESYRHNSDWALMGAWLGSTMVGAIGLQFVDSRAAEIRHIAVLTDHRHTGIGTRLIDHAFSAHNLGELRAETDKHGVGFYRKRAFMVRSLGEKYPGTERFWCTRQSSS